MDHTALSASPAAAKASARREGLPALALLAPFLLVFLLFFGESLAGFHRSSFRGNWQHHRSDAGRSVDWGTVWLERPVPIEPLD